MLKVLFVTEKMVTSRTLQNTLGDTVRVDRVGVGETTVPVGHDIILYDLTSDAPMFMADITRLRSLCGFKDTPLIVVVEPSLADISTKALQVGATGVIAKPFDKATTRESLDSALKPVGVKAGADSRVLAPFVSSTVPVIQEVMGSEVERKTTFLKRSYSLFGDVTTVVTLEGGGFGAAAISYQQDLAFGLTAKMDNLEERDLMLENVSDAMGRIMTRIADQVSGLLNAQGLEARFSSPSVVIGHGNPIAHRQGQPVITVIFEVNELPFALQICLSLATQGRTEPGIAVPAGS
jgi:CheY-specific phosphatase CheX